ncbi:hypothetical protein [Nocardioides bruguierae]|uniref:Secreted protein n=1 Tax=Nocardioides bruguierae TaxID=2945102 RepID=A0A9X2IH76_9ACTN|nr:hypothetical protein [Nocardioides bruguierae]MCM0622314.1 hypothetical protein [Nocardioides bruguierae]
MSERHSSGSRGRAARACCSAVLASALLVSGATSARAAPATPEHGTRAAVVARERAPVPAPHVAVAESLVVAPTSVRTVAEPRQAGTRARGLRPRHGRGALAEGVRSAVHRSVLRVEHAVAVTVLATALELPVPVLLAAERAHHGARVALTSVRTTAARWISRAAASPGDRSGPPT